MPAKKSKDKKKVAKRSWHDSTMFWGAFPAALAIVLMVVAGVKNDYRWVLIFAWALFVVAAWAIVRHSQSRHHFGGRVFFTVGGVEYVGHFGLGFCKLGRAAIL